MKGRPASHIAHEDVDVGVDGDGDEQPLVRSF